MSGLAWINGEFIPLNEAKIPLQDRGYFFGDGVYEVIKVYNGKAFTLDEHIKRLESSLYGIGIKPHLIEQDIPEIISSLLKKSQLKEAYIYIQVTRGIGPRKHHYTSNFLPFLTVFIDQLSEMPSEFRINGVSAITVPDDRWAHPHIKTINLLPNVLAKQKAHEERAFEAIFIRRDQTISEGTSSNVFAVFGKSIVTPPSDGRILPGISRSIILKHCQLDTFTFTQEHISYNELLQADELFISSTGQEILGVVTLDKQTIGTGKPGFVTTQLYEQFMSFVNTYCDDYS